MKRLFPVLLMVAVPFFSSVVHASTDSTALAKRIFQRLTGLPIPFNDPRLDQMVQLINSGKIGDAAAIATNDDSFFNLTVKTWASRMSTKAETPYTPLNDFQAIVIGAVRDGLDARTLLTGNYTYVGQGVTGIPDPSDFTNTHYLALDKAHANFRQVLTQVTPQRADFGDTGGLLTSRGWGEAFLKMGTNRRSIQYAFQEFLCTPITTWRDIGLPDWHVRRDVTRKPGGNPATFQALCRSCHAPMDAMAGAFAHFDFVPGSDPITGEDGGRVIYYGQAGIAPKYNQNAQNYPDGYVTVDDSWINYAIYHHNQSFGWKGPLQGNGVNQFGQMLANSDGFKACMSKRVFKEICKRDLDPSETDTLSALSQGFGASGYNLKKLFEAVAAHPACLQD